MNFYKEGIMLGSSVINPKNSKQCHEIMDNFRYNNHYMAIIDEAGMVYGIKIQAHKDARAELIKDKGKKDNEVIMGFYRNINATSEKCFFYDACKNDTNYPAVHITEPQMRAMYNLCLLCGNVEIAETFAEYSANMGLSYDDTDAASIVGNMVDKEKLNNDLVEAKEYNLPIFEAVTGIHRNQLNRAIRAVHQKYM